MDLADPRWFPVDLHVPDRRFGMLEIDDGVIDRSSFLDTRIEAKLADAKPLPVAQVPAQLPAARLGWLFHTSFCASTLLARALHLPPHQIALKEPLVLRRLSDAHHNKWSLDGLVAPTLRLLARPWHPGGAVVLKPTHVALNIAVPLLAAAPDSRAVILTCSLREFLISNLKKPADSQAKIPLLVERALRATSFRVTEQPPDMLCAAGLQWAAQRELMHDVVTALPARVRALDMQPLLDDLPRTVTAVADWLALPAPRDALDANARTAGARNAKATTTAYGPERRAHEAAFVAEQHADALARAEAWLESHVLAAMRPEAKRDPSAW